VAVDMKNQQEVVLSSGYLSKCMRASMAIPGAFKPVEINGKMLVDGGMLNNLTVDVVKAMGADVVVAIDLTQNKHETRDFSLKEVTGIGGILDWAVSRPDWKKYNENVKMVDVHINPNLAGYGATSFGKKSIDEMIKIGEQVGRKNRARLEALKKKVRGER
jgi:NTE family protein